MPKLNFRRVLFVFSLLSVIFTGLSGCVVYDSGYPGYSSYGYAAPAPGGDVAYCAQRFRSYDPASGTYLGYDGLRHPCP